MNSIDYLFKQIDKNAQKEAFVWQDKVFSYEVLRNKAQDALALLKDYSIAKGSLVIVQADFSPNTVAMLLALFKIKAIVTVLCRSSKINLDESIALTGSSYVIHVNAQDEMSIIKTAKAPSNYLYWDTLRERNQAGLILFSSGSTGKSKAIVHDVNQLLQKFCQEKKATRVIGFLIFDHIGGINTLFYTLFNGGCFIALQDRLPQSVCHVIEAYKSDALTTTPTFLNLLLLSKAYKNYDLSSLKYINFSTEKMSEGTFNQLKEVFPDVRFSQAYGLSEVGVLPAQSIDSNSLSIKLNKTKCDYRIINGMLEIKIQSSMLGYLNAPNPFTEDGWYKTGDSVEIVGESLKILGRQSEMINVGGEKVYPAEIEEIIESMPGVMQAAVTSEAHALIGRLIIAKVFLANHTETADQFKIRLNQFCQNRLPAYKIPKKVFLSNEPLHGERFKKMRNNNEVHHATN